ncbi:MAG TPA: histidine phosphotransferase family protein [Alphaproteobacteria bacterium]|nr:histidine phosphotransferase family protein [Alphaproteobacteria bacterium]
MSVSVDLRVLELVCSRICHDLVSPVGAVNNGVELIREIAEEESSGGGLEAEALALIAHSAEQGSRRLRVLRLAYGAAGADASWEEIRGAIGQFFTGSRIAFTWPPEIDFQLPENVRGFGKVLINAVLLAADSLGQNGQITVEARSNGATVAAVGSAPALDAERTAALAGRTAAADLDPRSIHAYVTARFAAHYGIGFVPSPIGTERLDFILTTP